MAPQASTTTLVQSTAADEANITRQVLERKALQKDKKAAKTQPWKTTYVVEPSDIPKTSDFLHDQPWFFNPDQYPPSDSDYGA
jgi:hypothetical protein